MHVTYAKGECLIVSVVGALSNLTVGGLKLLLRLSVLTERPQPGEEVVVWWDASLMGVVGTAAQWILSYTVLSLFVTQCG